jgi:biotin-dependent carboxylase-like uncharacterized protein
MIFGAQAATLNILSAGPGVSLQDGGRHGFLRYGVTGAGPMDSLAHATANKVVSNGLNTTAIEVSLGGAKLSAEGTPLELAVVGGSFSVWAGDRQLPPNSVFTLSPGEILKINAGLAGAWCYVAVAAGFDVPLVLGSSATHTRSGMGGVEGRALQAGDKLRVLPQRTPNRSSGTIIAPWLERPADVIRVVLGPQADYFEQAQIDAFLKGPWTISARGDRMACFLEGSPITHAKGYNIVSDGIVMGAIQVPGQGQPIILMADRQSTGGYPKIATVIGADLGRLAQARPGASLRFSAVTIDQAVSALREQAATLERQLVIEPLVRTTFSSEFLLGLNLIDGFVVGSEAQPC